MAASGGIVLLLGAVNGCTASDTKCTIRPDRIYFIVRFSEGNELPRAKMQLSTVLLAVVGMAAHAAAEADQVRKQENRGSLTAHTRSTPPSSCPPPPPLLSLFLYVSLPTSVFLTCGLQRRRQTREWSTMRQAAVGLLRCSRIAGHSRTFWKFPNLIQSISLLHCNLR